MGRGLVYIIIALVIVGCKPSEDRSCWKGHGEETSLVHPISGIEHFDLGKGLKYRFYQDSTNQIIIHGGENMVKQVEILQEGDTIYISNKNKCNFLRDADRELIVEIHSSDFEAITGEPSDSVAFMDTINTDRLSIKIKNGAASLDLNINSDFLDILLFDGSADLRVGGNVAIKTDLIVKTASYGDARDLICPFYFLHSRSSNDLYVNLDGSDADVVLKGAGDIIYSGVPGTINIVEDNADGEIIPQ